MAITDVVDEMLSIITKLLSMVPLRRPHPQPLSPRRGVGGEGDAKGCQENWKVIIDRQP